MLLFYSRKLLLQEKTPKRQQKEDKESAEEENQENKEGMADKESDMYLNRLIVTCGLLNNVNTICANKSLIHCINLIGQNTIGIK